MFEMGHLHSSILDLMSENPAHVSGCNIFTITKNIAAPSYWALKVYADSKDLTLRLSPVFMDFLVHRPSIFYLRCC